MSSKKPALEHEVKTREGQLPCCGGVRYWPRWATRKRAKFVYRVAGADTVLQERASESWVVARDAYLSPNAYFPSKRVPTSYLTECGHFVTEAERFGPTYDESHYEVRLLASGREADRMATRLNAGLPVFRDRWLGLGALLLVAAAVMQAMAAIIS